MTSSLVAIAPVVSRRHFDAVIITTGSGTYYLNRKRLETAIALIELYPNYPKGTSLAQLFRDDYPEMSSVQISNYFDAAVACHTWNVKI